MTFAIFEIWYFYKIKPYSKLEVRNPKKLVNQKFHHSPYKTTEMRQYWVTYWLNYLVFLLIHIMLLGFHGVLAEMCPEFGRIRGFKHEGLEHGKVSILIKVKL